MKYLFITTLFLASTAFASDEAVSTPCNDTNTVYWNTERYLSQLDAKKASSTGQYVYHLRRSNFVGGWIVPLNQMKEMKGFSEIYKQGIARYQGRERLLEYVIPTLNCLWNDVVFLSPLHPHYHYKAYQKIGFRPKSLQFFKIPIEVLQGKRVTVWDWPHYSHYPIYRQIPTFPEMNLSYFDLDFSRYQEMDEIPSDTSDYYQHEFNPEHPEIYPKLNWYRITHILCQDPIDLSDERITIINWEDSPEM